MSKNELVPVSTEVQFHNMEQRSPEWHAIRIGRVGGSESVGLTTPARMKTMIFNKLGEILSGEQKEIRPNEAMQRGIDLEPIAVEAYEEEEMVETQEVGYVTNLFYKYMGLSPDRLVGDRGALEVKCPGSAEHVKTIIEGVVPTKHEPQIATYFLVNEDLDWVDFVSYDDRVKARPYFKIRVTRSAFTEQINKLSAGYTKYEKQINEYLKLF